MAAIKKYPFCFFLLLLFNTLYASSLCVKGEFLYWIAHENGLTFAYDSQGSPCFVDYAKAKNPQFTFDPGFRLTIGTPIKKSDWEALLQYTHFHTYIHTDITAAPCHFLFPTWLNSAATCGGYVNQVSSRWRLHYGNLDIELERTFPVGRRLQITPLFGIRGTVARQKYLILYSGGSLFPCTTDKVHMKNKFWGIGPLAGVKGDLALNSWLSLYGSGSLALLYGHFYVHQSEYVECDRRLRLFNRFYLTRGIADLSLGLKGIYRRFTLNVGWEEHLFWGQNQLIRLVDHTLPGASISLNDDLTLSGLVLGLTIDF